MSALAEKLEAPARATAGGARQTLKQLRRRWGCSTAIAAAPPPDFILVEVSHASGRECWRRLDDGSRGDSQNYELEREP